MECHWRSRWANVTARVETIERQPPAGILRYRYKARNQTESTGKTAGSNFRSKKRQRHFSTKKRQRHFSTPKRLSYLPCPYEADIEPKWTGETAGNNFRSKNDKDIFRPKND